MKKKTTAQNAAKKKKTASAKRKTASKTAKKTTAKKIVARKKPIAKKTAASKTKTRKYGPKAQNAVEKEMHEYKRGRARSGPAKLPVKSRKQAIAIALSKARKEGAKIPRKKAA